MDLLDVFGDCHEAGDGAEGLAEVVGVEAGDDDADTAVGEGLGHFDEALVEELGLIDADDLDVAVYLEHPRGILDRSTGNAVAVVGDDVKVGVTLVHRGLESRYLLLCKLGPFEPSDEFFSLSGEHGAANNLDAARFFCIF